MNNSKSNAVSAAFYSNCAANMGGGIYFAGSSSSNTINGLIAMNYAANRGGGIYLAGSGSYNNITCTISSNRAMNDAGAIAIWGNNNSNTISNSIISYNIADSEAAVLYSVSGINNKLMDSLIYSNYTPGDIINIEAPTSLFELRNNVITNNNSGCILYLNNYTNTLPGLVISNNTFGADSNKTVCIDENTNLNLSNHIIMDNKFITNNLYYIYKNANASRISNNQISLLNTPSDPSHDANPASGNIVTNQ